MQDSEFQIIKNCSLISIKKTSNFFLELSEFKTFESYEELIHFVTFTPNFYYSFEGLI